MDQKRRDSKKRVLRTGESQRSDGRYLYKYTDDGGKICYVYSWKLVDTDPLPAGKKDCESLRELEKQIDADNRRGISSKGRKMTVVELCESYLLTTPGFRENTKAGHRTTMKILRDHPFGAKPIGSVKVMDAKLFLVSLQREQGRSYSSIHSIRGVLRPAFRLAYESEYISRNPFDFPLKDVLVNDSVTRDAITREQERKFLKFIREDPKFREYYDGIYILFKTGMRISEFCGLTLKDVNLKKRTICIDHQLQRKSDGTLYVYEDQAVRARTKTEAGVRTIPMLSDEVVEAFANIIHRRKKPKTEPIVDGITGFLILNERAKNGIRPMIAMDWEHIFNRIVSKYNSIYQVQLPNITPHVCRHTCCNNLANSGMAPSHLQYFMGHGDISVTMNNYVHTKAEDTMQEVERLKSEGKLRNMA